MNTTCKNCGNYPCHCSTTTFINLTPHEVKIQDTAGVLVAFPPSGVVARVSVGYRPETTVGGFRLRRQVYGPVENLPAPQEGVFLIVSGLVLGQCGDRADVIGPDTGKDALRDERGQIRGVLGFV